MRGPNLIRLVRSLRTKSYDRLYIRKYLDVLTKRSKRKDGEVPSEKEPNRGIEPHREIEPD